MSKEKILVVEDDVTMARLINNRLKHLEYNVAAIAASGEEAIEKASKTSPDLVLMDIMLKGDIDGIQTAEQIRNLFRIPVVFLTAYGDDELLQRAKIIEPFGFILKPFRERELRIAIEIALYKHRVEKSLRESEAKYRQLVELSPDAIAVTDLQGKILMVNEQTLKLFGCEKMEEIIGKNSFDLIMPEDRNRVIENTKKTLENGVIRNIEYTLTKKNGTSYSVELNAAILKDAEAKPIAIISVVRDVTERKQAEEEVYQSREQLRSLAARLQSIREEEQTRISRELHDELGHLLTALKIDLVALSKDPLIKSKPQADDLQSMISLTDHSLQTIKRIATKLRPGVLDHLGLGAAIEWQSKEFQSHTQIKCEIRLPEERLRLDKDKDIILFRILQEALTNVARHAQATNIVITLQKDKQSISMTVQDDGRGIKESEVIGVGSLGLLGMRERAHVVGGKLTITGEKGKGTTISVSVPID